MPEEPINTYQDIVDLVNHAFSKIGSDLLAIRNFANNVVMENAMLMAEIDFMKRELAEKLSD